MRLDSDGRPSSRKNPMKLMQRHQQGMSQRQKTVYMQTIRNAVFMQFMSGDDFIKGGAGIQIRYPLEEARMSKDVDATFNDSEDAFELRLAKRLKEGWEGFTGEIISKEHGPRTLMPEGSRMTPMRVKLYYREQPFASIDLELVPDLSGCA